VRSKTTDSNWAGLMRAARITNICLRDERGRLEPWKALLAAFAAGIAVASCLIAFTTWIVLQIARSV
jgi:hypothetical protein